MIYVALVEAVMLALIVLAFIGLLRSKDRAQTRERDLLLNQLLHAVDKPWQDAPANDKPAQPVDWDEVLPGLQYSRFTASPEQEP